MSLTDASSFAYESGTMNPMIDVTDCYPDLNHEADVSISNSLVKDIGPGSGDFSMLSSTKFVSESPTTSFNKDTDPVCSDNDRNDGSEALDIDVGGESLLKEDTAGINRSMLSSTKVMTDTMATSFGKEYHPDASNEVRYSSEGRMFTAGGIEGDSLLKEGTAVGDNSMLSSTKFISDSSSLSKGINVEKRKPTVEGSAQGSGEEFSSGIEDISIIPGNAENPSIDASSMQDSSHVDSTLNALEVNQFSATFEHISQEAAAAEE